MGFPYVEKIEELRKSFGNLPVYRELINGEKYKLFNTAPPFPAPCHQQIAEAESTLGVVLPNSYKKFVQEVSCGIPPQLSLFWIGLVDSNYEIVTRNKELHLSMSDSYQGRDLPPELIAFGDDEALDVFAFDYSNITKNGEPQIVLWHDLKEKKALASSFGEFIEQEITRLERYLEDFTHGVKTQNCITYKNFTDDVDSLCELLPRTRPPILLWSQAQEIVFERYLEQGKLDSLITLGHSRVDHQVRALSKRVVKEKDLPKFKRLWKGLLVRCESAYRDATQRRTSSEQEFSSRCVEYQTALEQAIAGYRTLGEGTLAKELESFLATVKKGEPLSPLPKPTDKRKIDKALFWSLIAEAKEKGSSPDGTLYHLERIVKGFKNPGVKKFDKLFNQQICQLYHWDVWALAYLRERGCSDDSFEYFRAGLVLLGEEVVETLCRDIEGGAKLLPREGRIDCEEALSFCSLILEERGAEPPTHAGCKLKGRKWEEEELVDRYPGLTEIFA